MKLELKSSVLTEPILVGRERELKELMQSLDSAIGGKGNTVFLSGEAGTGKTRLTTEFLNRAKKHGVTVLTGWCLSNAAVPYFPFLEAFNDYFSGERVPKETQQELDVTAWLRGPTEGERPGKSPVFSPQAWKDQTFVAVTKTLAAISARKPIILFIDDVHWADSASLALIHYIARAIRSDRILLVATFRSEELTADAEGRPHPLVETLRLMRREEIFEEIKLTNLGQTSVSELAESMLGGEVHQELAEKLSEESQGNALFIVESLRMLHERGGLLHEDGKWRLAGGELGIPVKIKDIILQRLNMLLRNQRRALDAASVIGEKFNAELLGSILGQDLIEIAETMDAIAQATSLVSCEGELYRFDHARSRDAIYDEISPVLRRGYHAKIAEKLEGMSEGGKPPLSEIAHHYAQAGNKEKAAKYALAAGQDALARWSNTDAINHFTYVLQATEEGPERAEERLSATEGLGDAFYANSMFKEATRIFEELGDTTETGIVRLRAYRKAMESTWQHGNAPHLIKLVEKAEPYVAADRLENARILMSRARAYTIQGDEPAAAENAEAALQVFEEEYSLWDAAWTSIGIGVAQSILGRREAIAAALRSIALFEELGDFRWQMEAYFAAGVTFNMCFLEHEALDLLAKAIEIDEKMKMGDYIRLFHAKDFSANSFFQMGDFEKALALSLEALELSKKTDSMWAHGSVYLGLTILYAMRGDLKNAEEFFEKFMKLPPEALIEPSLRRGLPMAVLFAGKNQWKESNHYFKEQLNRYKDHPEPANELAAKQVYAWALERQGRHEEAKLQLQECQKIRREAEARFEHADLQAYLMVRRQVVVGEEFEMRLDLVNVGRKPALLVKIEDVLANDFKVASSPPWCTIQDGSIEMKKKEIGAFQVNTAKLTVRSLKAGTFRLNPQVVYVDDLGETQTCNFRPVMITASPPAPKERMPGKIYSGTPNLDRLLLGGIPENHTIILAAPSSDERSLLIKRFVEEGAAAGETTFHITGEAASTKVLAEKHSPNFYLFLCNPQADAMVQTGPNVFKLKGEENLTDIDITLTKAFRTMNPSGTSPRRICIDIVSDVLLQHHAVTTRRWLSALLPTLKTKGFTTLAVVNPKMHPQEELEAVLGLFDGEITLYEKETPEGTARFLKVKKMTGQKYLKDEVPLTAR